MPLLIDDGGDRLLELGLGYRLSRYEQAGSADAYKVEFTFEPSRVALLRGSFQHAVRAPSIEELYYPDALGLAAFPRRSGGVTARRPCCSAARW